MSMDWKKCLNNREEINSVEVNPSKLIDSICHRLLLAKLKAYCFSSSALRLVSVFFVDRLQIVANLSTRRSWYHGRQPEVFLQHAHVTAHVKVSLNCGHGLQNSSSQVETRGSNSGFFEEYSSYKSRNSSSEIMFSAS